MIQVLQYDRAAHAVGSKQRLPLLCPAGQLHDGGSDYPVMTCHACQQKSCFTHDVPWHSGLTCEQYDAQTSSANTCVLSPSLAVCYLVRTKWACSNPLFDYYPPVYSNRVVREAVTLCFPILVIRVDSEALLVVK